MRKLNISKKILALILAAVIVLSTASVATWAATGDLSNVSTGLTGDIDTNDTVAFPITILDYDSDGMLFEYGESKEAQGPADFGSTSYTSSFTGLTSTSSVSTTMLGDFWSYTTRTINTSNSKASYVRMKWAKNSTQAPHTGYGRSAAGIIMPNDLTNLSMNDARYLTLVYRSNVTSGKIGFFVERTGANRSNTNNRVGDLTFTSEGTTNWTYAVYDLKQGNLKNTWSSYGTPTAIWVTLPIDSSGEYMDLAYACLFSDAAQAEKFGRYAITDGSDRGDNRGFGLLRSSRNEDGTDAYGAVYNNTDTVKQLNSFSGSAIDYSTVDGLGYTLLGEFGVSGIANIGLLESSLSDKGLPVYKQEVVEYFAGLLEYSLEIPERTSDGWKNYRYVEGTPSDKYGGVDLATALRNKINGNTGTYAQSAAKNLVGTWEEVGGNISSYHDAAYFLLNSIFVENSYNEPQDDYDHLILSAGTNATTGNKTYVFDAGFTTSSAPAAAQSSVQYDTENKTISNTSAAGKTHFVYEGSSTTTLNPFLPITDKNNAAGQTQTVYYQDDGTLTTTTGKDSYVNRNFNYVLSSKGEFVYHAENELFFDFEGDDDVYLFINGELVLDIGSAHSIDTVHIDINEYVNWAKETLNDSSASAADKARAEKLNLVEGNTYNFSFFYMERHGYGANMRISNNFKLSDPSMEIVKTAYQNESELEYGNIIDKDRIIEYGFSLKNNGQENLYNFTFKDLDIGVELTHTDGLVVTGSRVTDINGGALDPSDITVVLKENNAEEVTITFGSNEDIKKFLTDLTNNVISIPAGLEQYAEFSIRGIGYTLSQKQIDEGYFNNTVAVSATNRTLTKTLHGQDDMKVFVPADPMYYQWAGHELNVDKTRFIQDVLDAAAESDSPLYGSVPNLKTTNVNKIEFVTSNGNAITYENVTMDSNYNLTINYPSPGSLIFYTKITYDSSKRTAVVPVMVNITDVEDSVFVLDYGIGVDLADGQDLFKNDSLTVPGRDTLTKLWGVTSITPSYSPNNISFTAANGNTLDSTFGDFTVSDSSLEYIPDKFMNGSDSAYIAVGVYEEGLSNGILGNVNINKEVQMYKAVTVLPANVVYYEDNFPAVEYSSSGKNTIEAVEPEKEPLQNADQSEQYGHDSAYSDTTDHENSAGALTTITITERDTVASFTFVGTGFELIGRTNARDSATIILRIKDSSGKLIKQLPLITEYDNNSNGGDEEIYQVPIIRATNLSEDAQQYTVEIMGIPARDYDNVDENGVPAIIPTKLYIDGIRIYQPLKGVEEGGTVLEDLYIGTEQNVQFKELRKEIINGNVAVIEYNTTDGITLSTATSTWTEQYNESEIDYQLKFNEVKSIDDYMLQGPNNEVYHTGTYTNSALVMYVRETASENQTLQIGVRGLDESMFFAGIASDASPDVNALIRVGVYEDGSYKWDKPLATITSSTEQYYVIDYKNCYYDSEKGAYQVVIRVDDGMVSYSGIKLAGLEIVDIGGEKTDYFYSSGILMQPDEEAESEEELVPANMMYTARFNSLRMQMDSDEVVEDEEIPDDGTVDDGNTDDNITDGGTDDDTTDNGTVDDGATDGGADSEENRLVAFLRSVIDFIVDVAKSAWQLIRYIFRF